MKLKQISKLVTALYKNRPFFKKRKLKDSNPFGKRTSFSIRNNQGHIGIIKNEKKTVYIGVAGSNEWADWALNFKFFQKKFSKLSKKIRLSKHLPKEAKAHYGFMLGALRIWPYILQKIKNKKVVYLYSHSYGAGVTTILAMWIKLFDPGISVYHFPFSSPKVLNEKAKQIYKALEIETVSPYHVGDIVCNLPPWGYVHIDSRLKLGKLPWWAIISKTIGMPHWHYPDLITKYL